MDEDVRVVTLDDGTSAQVTDARTRLRGMIVLNGAAGDVLTFRDGGSGGTVKLTISLPLNTSVVAQYLGPFPGLGILFRTNMYVASTGNNGNVHQFMISG